MPTRSWDVLEYYPIISTVEARDRELTKDCVLQIRDDENVVWYCHMRECVRWSWDAELVV